MNTELIDISMPLTNDMPVWPGSPGHTARLVKSLQGGDSADATEVTLELHTGTHIDAPSHMLSGAPTMGEYDLATAIGDALVVDTGDAGRIDAQILQHLDIPTGTERLLLRTRNSTGTPLHSRSFTDDYVALTLDGAEMLVTRGVRLVGIDYLSIQRFEDPVDTHHTLFRGGVTILEGLKLDDVEPGHWELICLPLSLPGLEAAPARALLRRQVR